MIINANTRTRLIQHVKSFFDYISSAYGRFTSLEIALNTGCFEQLNFDVSTLTHPPCAPIFIYNGYSIYCYGHRYAKTERYNDDIGYINHYASAELIFHLMPKLKIKMGVDFEHNDFTSPHAHDIHFNGSENVYQGELELLYELTHTMKLKVGWQHGMRKFNYESFWVDNNNAWIGAEFHF